MKTVCFIGVHTSYFIFLLTLLRVAILDYTIFFKNLEIPEKDSLGASKPKHGRLNLDEKVDRIGLPQVVYNFWSADKSF